MSQAITIGDVVWTLVAAGGFIAVVGVAIWFLAAYAAGFKD